MKSKHKLGLMMAMAMAMNPEGHNYMGEPEKTPEEKEAVKREAKAKQRKHKGIKEFKFGSHYIYAINLKSATRKAKAKGYL